MLKNCNIGRLAFPYFRDHSDNRKKKYRFRGGETGSFHLGNFRPLNPQDLKEVSYVLSFGEWK